MGIVAAALPWLVPVASAQQQVRVPLPVEGGAASIGATLLAASGAPARAPAMVVLHGCGGIGQNHMRMAQHLQRQGIAVLVPDSFTSRGIRDACTRNWPSLATAEQRAFDIDATVAWLAARPEIAADRIGVMGYSYGGGVLLLRALQAGTVPRWRMAVAVYPDCALPDRPQAKLAASRPVLMTLAEKDDWTPVWQCTALLQKLSAGRELVETREYAGAHHSFDAVGLPVQYLAAAGNRSKPGSCCGAHYGHHPTAWRQFVADVDGFVARSLVR